MRLADLPTPFLLVDVAAVDRNVALARRLAGPIALRPHFKAHKCLPLLRRQVDAGGCSGVTCATADEALVLAEAGVADILVANEVVHEAALRELVRAAALTRVEVAADHPEQVERLDATAAAAGVRVGIVLDVDVGQRRCGMTPATDAIPALAALVGQAPALDLRGLMGYDGHVQHDDAHARRRSTEHTAQVLAAERERLERAGHRIAVVTGGGTGTLEHAAQAGVLTEVQAGSYVLMDAEYDPLVGFEPAVTCVATVVSRRSPAEAVLDCGLKALSGDAGLPVALTHGVTAVAASDEHLTVRVDAGVALEVGDPVAVLPRHLDPTMDLHDLVVARHDDGRLEAWPVAGRSSDRRRHERLGDG